MHVSSTILDRKRGRSIVGEEQPGRRTAPLTRTLMHDGIKLERSRSEPYRDTTNVILHQNQIFSMNIFVLSTGRCGSTTFAQACQYIKNFSVAHESRFGTLRDRVKYPDDHIEVDNRLSWFLGRLDRRYGDSAFYVHQKRDLEATAASLKRRYNARTIKAYRKSIIWNADDDLRVSPLDVCRHYCVTVNSNIELFLKDKTRSMEFRLESAKGDFREFWDRIGAEGNLSKSLNEWDRKHNASSKTAPLPLRAARKAARVVRKLPGFLKTA